MAALDGMRVLDLTQFEAGPACTQALAWLGADVVKVEKPGRGDRARGADRARNEAYAPAFCAWNANKRSLAIDIGSEAGHALFLRLVPKFDVLVENFGPGVMERLGIDHETLGAVSPGLIQARIKGFGNSGPHAGFAVGPPIAQAASGAFSINGRPDGPPLLPGPMGDAAAGVYAAVAVLAAWTRKLRTGRGQWIDISMQEAMTLFVRGRGAIYAPWGARAARRSGNIGDAPSADLYPCKPYGPNDHIYLTPMTEDQWGALCEAMGRPELRTDLRFYSPRWRLQNHRALREEISSWTRTQTKHEAMETLCAAGVPSSACLDTADMLDDRHLTARGFMEEIELPVHGKVRVPGFAPRLSASRVPLKRPPRLGEHTGELLRAELGLDDAQLEALREAGTIGGPLRSGRPGPEQPVRAIPPSETRRLTDGQVSRDRHVRAFPAPPDARRGTMAALDGMKVLDMTQYEAGPACTQVLAWLGADVVKVEPPGRGDGARNFGGDANAYSAFFCAWNANKRSLAVDLGGARGRDLLLRLARRFDVFVENYSPGVIERFDIGYETLSAINPGLIYTRIKGFGLSGPHAGFRSVDPTAQAAAGAFSVNGEADGPPTMPGPTLADSGTGLQAAMAVLAAWTRKQRSGEGQLIELSMQEATTYYLRSHFFGRTMSRARPAGRSGNSLGLPPAGLYACKPFGRNDYIYLQPLTDGHWDALCEVMDRAGLRTDPRFYSTRWRLQNAAALREEIGAWVGKRTKHEAMEVIAGAGVPCSACLDTADLHRDPHLAARGFIHELELPVHGRVRMLGFAPESSALCAGIRRPPLLGEHSGEVLNAELGLDGAELQALRDAGVIRDAARVSPS